MGALEVVLLAGALLVGFTGTWSPCGFSMIETIGPTGHEGGQRTTIAACATFLPGALAGGILTFGGLAALGSLLPAGAGEAAYIVAALIALAAAALEATGTPIVPQIRRQLPEHWRRVMPMPVAAALYGGLLGLGFTTFVLTFGVWAIAAISFAVGEPAIGIGIGAAFGVGRALPIVVLAPLAGSTAGARAIQLMADRPGIYRGLRAGDAVALVVAAAVLAGSSQALAERTAVRKAADPSAGQGLVYQGAKRTGYLRRGGNTTELPGKDPAMGGPYIAVRMPSAIQILDSETLDLISQVPAEKANALAVSRLWLVWRAHINGRDEIRARRIETPESPNDAKRIQRAKQGRHLGMPSVERNAVAYSVSSERRNTIVRRSLTHSKGRKLVSSDDSWLHSASLGSSVVVFVRAGDNRQSLVQKRLGGGRGQKTLFSRSRGAGTLWSTALTADRAYVTLIQGGPDRILSTSR